MGEQKEGDQKNSDAEIAFVGGWLLGSGIGILLGDVKIGILLGAGIGVLLGLLRMVYGSEIDELKGIKRN
ncbi:hypothetical protein FTO70_13030 [Methanosarcina sp. KYL-1]|uniref:hypothetical protein n=1 Tax=Methanosarcina sp. KYL-1 TaxID=2602068 RepID=UPI002100AA89|nr:hypothetical protein [Methanosarcina sp. KYL-1]MCQ1536577.1 hypothetical protein [Methanosarcina sp. KYL-1]